jgi:hypothetical protein
LFLVKKEVFEWIQNGKENIELRRGRAKRGIEAVFQCGRKIIKGRIVTKEEGILSEILRLDNYKSIVPIARTVEEATEYLRGSYEPLGGQFTAYYFSTGN